MIAIDTTFLIDLQRGSRHRGKQAAERWLEANQHERLVIPAVTLGEFAEGFDNLADPTLMRIRTGYPILNVDAEVSVVYGRISRELRLSGKSIRSNDTWIAATALANDCRLLTRNPTHFRRVPGLQIETYR